MDTNNTTETKLAPMEEFIVELCKPRYQAGASARVHL